MKSRFIIITLLLSILAFGFLFLKQNNSYSGKNEGNKSCSHSGCLMNKSNQDIKAGGEWSEFEFISDKAVSDEMKSSMKKDLMNLNGIKEVSFGPGCTYSKMTKVIIYYSSDEVSQDAIASFVKDKEFNCPDDSSCPRGKCNMKKEKNTKNI